MSFLSPVPSGEASEALVFRVDSGEGPLSIAVDPADALGECHEENNTMTVEEALCP